MLTPSVPQLRGLDFFPSPDVPLSVFRVTNGAFQRHSHDFYELVLAARGTAQHETFASDCDASQCELVTEGDLFLIPLNWSHCYKRCDGFEIFNVLFDASLLQQWDSNSASSDSTPDFLRAPSKWRLQRGEREHLETLLQTIIRELTSRQRGFGIAVQAKLAEVLVWLDRLNARPPEWRAPESQSAVLLAIFFMEERFADPIGLADIARAAHLSAHYFCEVFKNATEVSPGRYLLRLRLEHARYLLLTTTLSVSQVARESGFADASYFARAFKSSFGIAPSRLRVTGR